MPHKAGSPRPRGWPLQGSHTARRPHVCISGRLPSVLPFLATSILVFFFFSALHPERILEARKPNGHGFLFDVERKKKQREKAQDLYVSLRILSERASHSECQLGAEDLCGVWGQ